MDSAGAHMTANGSDAGNCALADPERLDALRL